MQVGNTDFRAAISRLIEGHVRFVVIGGLAMIVRGATHITGDIDVAYDRSKENLSAIAEVLRKSHARLRNVPADLPFILDERTFRNVLNLTLTTDVGDMDLLAVPDGVDSFEGLWNRGETMDIYGMDVRVASIDDLIAMKRVADRPKDRLHVLELLDLQQMLIDDARAGQAE